MELVYSVVIFLLRESEMVFCFLFCFVVLPFTLRNVSLLQKVRNHNDVL